MSGHRPARGLRGVRLAAVLVVLAGADIAAARSAGDATSARSAVGSSAAGAVPVHRAPVPTGRDYAVAAARAGPLRPAPEARAVVVPHHWLAGGLIVAGVRDAAAGRPVSRVVLVGPNHIGAGGAPVTTSDGSWDTARGRVDADVSAVRALVAAGAARLAPAVLTPEHSVAGLAAVLAAEVPGARVVPLVVRPGVGAPEARALAEALVPWLDGSTLLVASVDFSHHLPPGPARARDAESLAALAALDAGTVLGWSDEHLDSAGTIATVMLAMARLGATTFELRAHTTSAELAGPGPGGVTTYVYGIYR